jgi:hypothetical protein
MDIESRLAFLNANFSFDAPLLFLMEPAVNPDAASLRRTVQR